MQTEVLDDFEDLLGWMPVASGLAELRISPERGPAGAAATAPTGPLRSRPETSAGQEKTRTFMSVPFCCSTLILTPAAGSFTPYCGLSANQ